MLGELVELTTTLDRAIALQEGGTARVSVFRAFDASASDRNLCIASEPRVGVQQAQWQPAPGADGPRSEHRGDPEGRHVDHDTCCAEV